MRAGVLFITSYEEPALLARFKEEYATYCARVPRWLPKR
jgi:protein-S-isoprenylcysteine O-methyltransferase Ste14